MEAEDPTVFLRQNEWKTVTLISVTKMSHDSSIFKFALPSSDLKLGLPVGQHVLAQLTRKPRTSADEEGETVKRSYTPVTQQGALGYIELLVKCVLIFLILRRGSDSTLEPDLPFAEYTSPHPSPRWAGR